MTSPVARDLTAVANPMPVRVKDPTVPTTPWTPPLNAQTLQYVLSKARGWEPVDWDLVFDDLAAVLGDEVSHHAAGTRGNTSTPLPEYDHADEFAQRFRGALMQLVNRGMRDEADRKYPEIAELIERARSLRTEELPSDPWQALGLLRRLGWVTLELAERLEAVGIVKGLVEC